MKQISKWHSIRRAMTYIVPAALFAAMLSWFLAAASNAGGSARRRELAAVKATVENGVTLCYAIEGAYPESVEYLTENYGLIYDKGKYIVHYDRFADNVRPIITILERRSGR